MSQEKAHGRQPAKATSFDIAYQAGVSQPTVSRALRGSPQVSEETRQRVLAVARQLNYTVDKNASNLRFQRSNTLALLIFEDPTADDSAINPFFVSMLGSVTRACAQRGYDLLVSFQQQSGNWHEEYEDSHRADGLILLGYGDYLQYRSRLERLTEQGTHFVRWGAVQPGQPGLSIGSDNYQGGYQAARHLLALGRRSLAFLGGASTACPEFLDRYHGFLHALEEAGIASSPRLQVDAITTEQSGYAAACELLSRALPCDAIVGASDLIALGALRALKEQHRSVPAQVAVVGFDDIPAAGLADPPLTTIAQNTRLAGEVLVETLLRRIRDEPAEGQVLPTRLVVRHSCGAGVPRADPR
ncbi:MAG TPA: LacI family DNA-binding transcriptional regulator [Candidatus Dormibacteraeota bacterium]|nr:LacI family DNA-binding transcriptional regulator [Candidatus Dormibacteraeota bacterium]